MMILLSSADALNTITASFEELPYTIYLPLSDLPIPHTLPPSVPSLAP